MEKADIINYLNTWIETMRTLNPVTVRDLYTEDSQFWGTMASQLSTDPASRLQYFEKFLDGKNGLSITIENDQTVHCFADTGLVSGTYVFKFGDTSIPARYSFAFNENGQIIHHHSSLIPS